MRLVSTSTNSEVAPDLHDILVDIPSVDEVVTADLEQLRPQFNLSDKQIEQLGKRPVATAKPRR